MVTIDDVLRDMKAGKAGIKDLEAAVKEEKAARAETLRALTGAAFEAGRGGNASLLAEIQAEIDGAHYIKLPYQITPNSVLYWNAHTEMPGIATFNDKNVAATFYKSECGISEVSYGDK